MAEKQPTNEAGKRQVYICYIASQQTETTIFYISLKILAWKIADSSNSKKNLCQSRKFCSGKKDAELLAAGPNLIILPR
jgi:hypothetical protein